MKRAAAALAFALCVLRFSPNDHARGIVPGIQPTAAASETKRGPLSPRTSNALLQIAQGFPCAATALIHLLGDGAGDSGEVLYLDEVPSPELLDAILRSGALHGGPQRNLYADISYLIEIRWSTDTLRDDVRVVTFRARLIRPDGVPVEPAHLVEHPAVVLISSGEPRLISPVLGAGAI